MLAQSVRNADGPALERLLRLRRPAHDAGGGAGADRRADRARRRDRDACRCCEADGRVLAEAVVAPIPLPPFDNSAVDGYAVRFADLAPAGRDRCSPVTRPHRRRRPAVAAGGRRRGAHLHRRADAGRVRHGVHAGGRAGRGRPGGPAGGPEARREPAPGRRGRAGRRAPARPRTPPLAGGPVPSGGSRASTPSPCGVACAWRCSRPGTRSASPARR